MLKPSIKILKHLPVKDDESLELDTGVIFRICGARILKYPSRWSSFSRMVRISSFDRVCLLSYSLKQAVFVIKLLYCSSFADQTRPSILRSLSYNANMFSWFLALTSLNFLVRYVLISSSKPVSLL